MEPAALLLVVLFGTFGTYSGAQNQTNQLNSKVRKAGGPPIEYSPSYNQHPRGND
jgi:hypothetical protein